MEPGSALKAVSQLRRGVLEYCVLALLRERPRYGVELVRELGAADAMVTSEGTIYPLLSRLRRTLGGLLLARPYRIAPGIDVRLPDLAGSAFVAGSTAPGVRALAARRP